MMNLTNITNSQIKAVIEECSGVVKEIIKDRFILRLPYKKVFQAHDISTKQVAEIIENYIFSERDRKVLYDHFINGYTFEKIAEIHELSTVQAKRIVYDNEMTVFKHL